MYIVDLLVLAISLAIHWLARQDVTHINVLKSCQQRQSDNSTKRSIVTAPVSGMPLGKGCRNLSTIDWNYFSVVVRAGKFLFILVATLELSLNFLFAKFDKFGRQNMYTQYMSCIVRNGPINFFSIWDLSWKIFYEPSRNWDRKLLGKIQLQNCDIGFWRWDI